MHSINRQLILLGLVLMLAACAAPAPKPVITIPASNAQEEVMLKQAEKDYTDALLAMRNARYDEAERLLKSMTEKYPGYAGPYANLGIVYANTKREKLAEQAFHQAIERNAGLAKVYEQQGYFYRKYGRFKEAREAYRKAVEVDPGYASAYLNLGILNDLYLMDNDGALKAYIKYAELINPPKNDPVVKWIADLSSRKRPAPPPQSAQQPTP